MGFKEQGTMQEAEQAQEYRDKMRGSNRRNPRDLFCAHGNTQK